MVSNNNWWYTHSLLGGNKLSLGDTSVPPFYTLKYALGCINRIVTTCTKYTYYLT